MSVCSTMAGAVQTEAKSAASTKREAGEETDHFEVFWNSEFGPKLEMKTAHGHPAN